MFHKTPVPIVLFLIGLLTPFSALALDDILSDLTGGGKNGSVVRVTQLGNGGEGSLREVLKEPGPKIIVFEVGGVIDLGKEPLEILTPFTTIAGQTAPSPGITFIRGGLSIRTHDVIVQHLRIRPGEAGEAKGSGWGPDGISTSGGARRVVIDHCSLTWAIDENLSASGPRFAGAKAMEWRENTSHDIVFSHNIIAEGLSNSTHSKFEHSKGMLLHDNTTNILIHGNLFAHNLERNPLLKGGVHVTMANNFIYNPGTRAVHYNLLSLEWGDRPHENGRLTAIGNVLRAGPSTRDGLAFLMLGGNGDLDYHGRDNTAVDWQGNPLPLLGRYTTADVHIINHPEPLDWPQGLLALPSASVEQWVLKNAGARPWDRDTHDQRIISDVAEGRGKIVDSEQEVGGYPSPQMSRRTFDPSKWDLETMTPLTTP